MSEKAMDKHMEQLDTEPSTDQVQVSVTQEIVTDSPLEAANDSSPALPADLEDELSDLLDLESDLPGDLESELEQMLADADAGDVDDSALDELTDNLSDDINDDVLADLLDTVEEETPDLELSDDLFLANSEEHIAVDNVALPSGSLEPEIEKNQEPAEKIQGLEATAEDDESLPGDSFQELLKEVDQPIEEAVPPDIKPKQAEGVLAHEPALGIPDFLSSQPSAITSHRSTVPSFVAIVMGLVALTFGGIGIWMADQLGTNLDGMQRELLAIQADVSQAPDYSRDINQGLSSINLINARLNELGVQLADLRVATQAGQLDASEMLSNRIQLIELSMHSLEKQAEAVKTVQVVIPEISKRTPSKPVVSPKPIAVKVVKSQPPIVVAKAAPSGWVINLASFSTKKSAEYERLRLKGKGVVAEVSTKQKNGKVLYRLQIANFSTYDAAKKQASTLKAKAGISGAWVGESG